MSSLIEDYSYDVFISYRQKDNKYDRWVSTFVENLKLELEATFKDDIDVYFDMNPLDGLAESHEILDSLKNKLKCVIFIPILSQTYCDPKSFAFENEFKVFVQQASHDRIGLKVKLSNGNVSSRVLPVRINELNIEDLRLVESITGGPLRAIDFIYRAHGGVNRPLRQFEDNPQENFNKSFYRNQINKVAQSIKDIILSIKGDTDHKEFSIKSLDNINPKSNQRKILILKALLIFIPIVALIYFLALYPGRLNSQELLNKAISHYDFYSNWQSFNGKLHHITLFNNGEQHESIIEIRTKENYYKSSSFSNTSKDTIIRGIMSGKYFSQINQNLDPDQKLIEEHNLDSLSINNAKHHHYWHFGSIMFLKNSELILSKKVVRTEFFGRKCMMLSFVSDSLRNSDSYLDKSIWNVYINPDNYSVLGYNIKGGWYKNGVMVVCEGELNLDKINIPMYKFYYNNSNDIQWVDLFYKEDSD